MNMIKKAYTHNVIELFESQVKRTPLFPALHDSGQFYTYKSLNEKANQLAHCLKKQQVGTGDFVGILLEPGIDFIVSVLAIVKLGAVYLPLDALAPPLRLVEVLEHAKPKRVITSKHYWQLINAYEPAVCLIEQLKMESINYPCDNLNIELLPEAPLYMMYTSGSTGKKKGVIVPHQAMVNLVYVQNDFCLKEGDVIAQFSNLAFDASPLEIWSALLHGAKLAIVPLKIKTDPVLFKQFIEEHAVCYLSLPTGFFHQLLQSAPQTLNAIRRIIFGGEQVNVGLLKKFLAYRKKHTLPIELINGYGPTEATAYSCRQKMTEQSILSDEHLSSIGHPIDNVLLHVLDENKNLATEGELYISGINLALGYHQEAQNNARFIANPFAKEKLFHRMYKTGDRVRRLASGEYLFLGRFDDQVKISGFRIHLSEIEQQLLHFSGISLAAVTVEISGGLYKMLTAYLVLSSANTVVNAEEIHHFLSKHLPSYMLPAKYVQVDELPLTSVGKVDKTKLDALPHTDLSFHVDIASSSTIEERIKKIWQHLLNRKVIDARRNLFELGANSLLITEACSRINQELQCELQVADLFSYPTIYTLSSYLEGKRDMPVVKPIKEIDTDEIAIVGMACRFPGANSLDEFWHNLCVGKESLTRFNEDESGQEHVIPVRGILSGIDQFDAPFFGYNPGDAHSADPQQRLLLECAWEALEHAAIAPNKIDKTISVFAGTTDSTYLHENLLKSSSFINKHDTLQQRIATSTSMVSTQISYRLNLRGRSVNVNTACSTGLVAVDQACQDLILKQSDIALVGTASIVVPQIKGYHYQADSIYSADGRCAPFSSAANGTVFSNGVAVVVLKRLTDAVAAGDTIYAVIKGRGVNNDGADKLGFAAPSTQGQMSCIRDALAQARIDAEEVGYVEAHGAATALGDAVEINALSAVYREQTEKKQFCFLGSVKGNIGHTDVSAGLAGLIKTALCLYHRRIPAMCHFKQPNPQLALHESPFVVNTQMHDWRTAKYYAGVSSLGVGGTNAHLILSAYETATPSTADDSAQLFIFSAKTEQALTQNIQQVLNYLRANEENIHLADAAYTLQQGREEFPWRCFAVGKNIAELSQSLAHHQPMYVKDQTPYSKQVHTPPDSPTEDYQQILIDLGQMWQQGTNINWQALHHQKRKRIALPTYAFQRQRYWIEPDLVAHGYQTKKSLYQLAWSHQPAYLESYVLNPQQLRRHSWILFKDNMGIAEQIAKQLLAHGVLPIVIESGVAYCQKSCTQFVINIADKTHYVALFNALAKQLLEPIIFHCFSCDNGAEPLLSLSAIESQLERGFYSVLYMTQAYIEHFGGSKALKCAVMTTGTQQVIGTETMAPVNATLIGAVRVIRQEHRAFQFRLLDFPCDELLIANPKLASYLIDACLHQSWNGQQTISAYRHGYGWDSTYTEVKTVAKKTRFKDEGVYLITGGLGGMGLSLSEAIAKTVVKPKLILLSRSPVIPELEWNAILANTQHPLYEQIRGLKKLQDLGAVLFWRQTDVGELDSLAAAVTYYQKKLGVIDGVIHAAGVAGNGLMQLKTKEMAENVFTPKVQGTYNLAKALQGLSLDFVVLMSSIATITGEKGQIDYCGANACLDAFASSRFFSAKWVCSVNWNTWRDVGMTVKAQRPQGINYFGRGNDISPQQGQQLFLQVMECQTSNVVISNYNPERYTSQLFHSDEQSNSASSNMTCDALNVADDSIASQDGVEKELVRIWQESLGIEAIGLHDDFFALGGHSLCALSLIEKINKAFNSSISIQHLYHAPTMAQLSQAIQNEINNREGR
jgi:amino acid adenylation domain-containing protein